MSKNVQAGVTKPWQDGPSREGNDAAEATSGCKDNNASVDDAEEEKEETEEIEPNDDECSRSDQSTQPDEQSDKAEAEDKNDLEAAKTTASSVGPPYSVYSKREKTFIVIMAATAGFFSPLSATIFIPALNDVAHSLDVSKSLVNLSLTTYMIFQGLAPAFMGSLGDQAGRRPAIFIGFCIYIAACIGIALQSSFAALLILRCLQSAGSSSFVALCSGVAADISTSAERGIYMGWTTSGMSIGPAIGPIIGGAIAQESSWRWIFWVLAIAAGVYLVPFLIAYPETGRNVVGNGSIPPQPWNQSLLSYFATRNAAKDPNQLQKTYSHQSARDARDELARKRRIKFPNPLAVLKIIIEPDIAILLLFNSLVYTAFYDFSASLPYLLGKIYGYNPLQIGLCFLPWGISAFIAPVMNGRLLDWNFQRVAKKAGITVDKKRGNSMKDFPLERARIPVAIPLVFLGGASLTAYGWVMEAETHIAVPLVISFILGLSLIGAFNVFSVILVDYYPTRPATATAANNLVRCLMGAGGTAVIIYMIEAMGRGWCFTFIAFVVWLSTPALYVLMRWGPGWRKARAEKAEKAEADQKAQEAK